MALSEPMGTSLFVGNVVLGLTVVMASMAKVGYLVLLLALAGAPSLSLSLPQLLPTVPAATCDTSWMHPIYLQLDLPCM